MQREVTLSQIQADKHKNMYLATQYRSASALREIAIYYWLLERPYKKEGADVGDK